MLVDKQVFQKELHLKFNANRNTVASNFLLSYILNVTVTNKLNFWSKNFAQSFFYKVPLYILN